MTIIHRYLTFAWAKSLGNIGFVPPVTDGLVGLYLPRKDAATAAKNHMGGADATIFGTPVFSDFGAELSRFAYLDTVHPETAIAEKQAAGAALISTYNGSASTTPFGHPIFRNAAPQRIATLSKTTPASGENDLGYDFPGDTDPEFFAGVADVANAEHRTYWPRLGVAVTGGNPRHDAFTSGAARNVSALTWRIGATKIADTSSLYGAATVHHLDMIFDRALNDAEIAATYAAAKAFFTPRGVAI